MPREPGGGASLTELLQRLESALDEVGKFDRECWQPGLLADEVIDLAGQSGLAVPVEVVTLYQWHNGTQYRPGNRQYELPGGWGMCQLETALQERAEFIRTSAADFGEPELVELRYDDMWLPWATAGGSGGILVIDCSRPNEPRSPVLNYYGGDRELLTESVAAMVQEMLALHHSGEP